MIIDSPVISGSLANSGSFGQVGDVSITGSLTVTGNINGNITGSAASASQAVSASYSLSSSYASTASSADSFLVRGTLTAQTIVVQTITSSVEFITGSTHFGSIVSNTHEFTGSVGISGSLAVNGSPVITTAQTSSLVALSASYAANATTSSYALTASYAANVPVTASYANQANSSSYALTASYWSGSITSASYALTASAAPLYLPLAGGTLTGNLFAAGKYFQFQDLILGYGTTQGTIKTDGGKNIDLYPTNAVLSTRFWANGNITVQTGGTFTDYGYKLDVSGSGRYTNGLTITGSLNAPNITGSLLGTASYATTASLASTASYWSGSIQSASYALTASYALNAGAGAGFPYSGSAVITGSLLITNLTSSGTSYLVADANGNITAQSASAAIKTTQPFTATANQTTFAVSGGYVTGYVDVFINGSKLSNAEFNDTSGTNIVLATGSFVNDVVEVVKYMPAAGVSSNVLRQLTTFTATAGQTIFSVSYTPGLLDIYYNGARLTNSDFTAANGTSITLATASAAGDILDVMVYSYQVGAMSGIGGQGVGGQIAYYNTTNSITGSPNFSIVGSTINVTGSFIVSSSATFTNIGPAIFSGSVTSTTGFTGSFSGSMSGTATSASAAISSSYATSATSASYSTSASAAVSAASATSASYALNASTAANSTLFENTASVRFATTASNNFTAPQHVTDLTVPTGFANTSGSIYTDGGMLVSKDSYFSGSMFIKGNLTIYGTQSVAYITSSQLNIATNLITVNTATPSVRFGGLAVYDSGSTGTGMTGSLLWDSQNNSWIYDNPSGSGNYDSAMVIMGPRNASSLGSEQGLNCNYLIQGHGHHHTTSSQIYHDGTNTCIPNNLIGSTICSTMGNHSCMGVGTQNPSALLHISSSTTACDLLRISNGTQSLNIGVNNGSGGSYIFENCAQDFRIGTNAVERMRITSTGIACFACQVCLSNQLVVQDGANSIFPWSSCGNFQPGMFAQSCIGSSYSGLYAKVYGSQVNAGVFGTNTQCVAVVVTEGACNKGLMIGTMNSAPLYIGTTNAVRATIASGGETTFNCQVCIPSLIASNCISINTANPGTYKFYVCNGTVGNKVARIDIGYAVGAASFSGLDIFRSNTNTAGEGASITFSGLRSDFSDVEYAGYGYVIENCTAGSHSGALSLMTTYAGNARCERVRIIGNGNVGIGTVSPGYSLETTGCIGLSLLLAFRNSWTTGTINRIRAYCANDDKAIMWSYDNSPAGTIIKDNNSFLLCVNGNNALTVTSTGNVGICNTAAATKLGLNSYVGARLPYINGTSNTFDGNGITVGNSNNGNTNIGGGIDFTNNCFCVGAYSPILSFSSVTTNYAYNNAYAGIWGVFQGAGGDANWGKGDLAFGTAGAYGIYERMRISNTGLVTKPYQTYFNVRASTNQGVAGDAKITYDTIVCSVGGNFNTSTSRFTAPVAGVYVFTLSNSVISGGIHTYHALYIKVNGNSTSDVNYRFRGAANSCTGQWFGIGGSAQLNLAANDYVEIFGYTDNTTMTLQSSEIRWQGYLQG